MNQPSLFDQPLPPHAQHRPLPSHANDPASSREAAKGHQTQAASNRVITLNLVRQYPGCTSSELWDHATLTQREVLGDYHELRRRLYDLKKAAVISRGEERICVVAQNKQCTWTAI